MKKWIILSVILGVLPLGMQAQDDDMYFVPTKKNVEKDNARYGLPRDTYYSGSSRSVDDYNRQGSYYEVISNSNDSLNDVIDFSAVQGVYPDSVSDFQLTRRMERFDGYQPTDEAYLRGYRDGRYASTWHSPWYYSTYYPWYDPWFDDPWYYSSWRYGWYDPWYYRPWGYPYRYYGWGYTWGRPYYYGHVTYRPRNVESHRQSFGASRSTSGRSVGRSTSAGRSSFGASRSTGNSSFGASRPSSSWESRGSSGSSFGASGGGSRGSFGGSGGGGRSFGGGGGGGFGRHR